MYRRLHPAARIENGRRGEAALIAALLYMILIAALLVAMTTQALVGQRSTRESRDYLLANQMANMALSDALFQLNQAKLDPALFPKIATVNTQCGISMASAIKTESTAWKGGVFNATTGVKTTDGNLGCGQQSQNSATTAQKNLFKSAKWQWYVEQTSTSTSANVSNKYRVYAVGGFNGAIRTVTSDLFSMQIRAALKDGDSIVYDTAPSTVFSHAIFGSSEVKLNASTVIKSADGSQGTIGSNDKISDVAATSKYAVAAKTSLYDYANQGKGNTEARCNLGDLSTVAAQTRSISNVNVCYDKVRIASQLKMNRDVIDNAANTCTQEGEVRDWKASDYVNPVFYATGDMACYKDINFDKATQIIGDKTYGLISSGKVSISAPITTAGTGSLILYHALSENPGTTGVIDFVDASPSTPTNLNLYIYSPNGTCNFTGAAIIGGIACDKVSLTSSTAQWKGMTAGVDQPGFSTPDATLFNRTIWYLGNFDEKAASNPNL